MNNEPRERKSIAKIMRSNNFATWIAIVSMIAQSKHTFEAFLSAESTDPGFVDIGFAVLAAVVIDLAILFYTLRNRKDIAIGAMFAMIAINAYAYWIVHNDFNINFYAGCFFSLIIPISVLFYSDEIKATRTKTINKQQ